MKTFWSLATLAELGLAVTLHSTGFIPLAVATLTMVAFNARR